MIPVVAKVVEQNVRTIVRRLAWLRSVRFRMSATPKNKYCMTDMTGTPDR